MICQWAQGLYSLYNKQSIYTIIYTTTFLGTHHFICYVMYGIQIYISSVQRSVSSVVKLRCLVLLLKDVKTPARIIGCIL